MSVPRCFFSYIYRKRLRGMLVLFPLYAPDISSMKLGQGPWQWASASAFFFLILIMYDLFMACLTIITN